MCGINIFDNQFLKQIILYQVIMKMRAYKTKIEGAKLLKEISDRLNKYGKKEEKLRNFRDL